MRPVPPQKTAEYQELWAMLTYRPESEYRTGSPRHNARDGCDILAPPSLVIPSEIYGMPTEVLGLALDRLHFEWSAAIRAATRVSESPSTLSTPLLYRRLVPI